MSAGLRLFPAPRLMVRRTGFTMIELVAVIVIIAILAAVAGAALSDIGDTRAAAAARLLQRDLTFARQRAVATGTVSWVTFSPAAETWSVLAEDPANPGRANATLLTNPGTGMDFTRTVNTGAYADVEILSAAFEGNTTEVGFTWEGEALNATEAQMAGDGLVTFTGNHVVRVSAPLGHISYEAP